jgi:uncharacterized protein (TIGR02246 family)
MKALPALCCVAALACGMSACNGNNTTPAAAPDTHDTDVKAISDTEAQWNKDYETRDVDKLAAHYADDAVLMVPGSPVAKGVATVRSEMQEMMKDPGLTLKFHATMTDVAKSGDLGYTQGSYVLTATDPKTHKIVTDHGSYVTTYRKQTDGSWKAVADIATSEVPSMPIPAKKM